MCEEVDEWRGVSVGYGKWSGDRCGGGLANWRSVWLRVNVVVVSGRSSIFVYRWR